MRLTELGEGDQDTRRRVPMTQLASLPTVEVVLQKLETARLLTAERESEEATYVDVAHEALIREWPRLREWLDEDREGQRIHSKLTRAAEEWEALDQTTAVLYRGVILQRALDWVEKEHQQELNILEQSFLAASVAQAESVEREAKRIEREREEALAQAQALATEQRLRLDDQEIAARSLRERARVAIGFAVLAGFLLVVASIFGWQSFQNAREADRQREVAQANFELAQQQLVLLEGERLLQEARQLREALDPEGAIAKFEEAAATDPTLKIDLSEEISDTLRYVATAWVQEGERLLREAEGPPSPRVMEQPISPLLSRPGHTGDLANGQHLQPESPLATPRPERSSPLMQQAVISATELFSKALALNPPSDTPVYVWIPEGEFTHGIERRRIGRVVNDEEKPQHTVSARRLLDSAHGGDQ